MIRLRMQLSMSILLVSLMYTALLIPSWSFSGNRETRHLFAIQRSKNANVVQYDAQLTAAGKLNPKEPIIAYWIMLAEDGRKQQLLWVEREMAYGFKAKFEAGGTFAIMDMVAPIGRKVKVYDKDGMYRAETLIDGRPAFVERIYIKSIEGGVLPKVEYVELFGQDIETGDNRYEKLIHK
jgi:hypothetical protein